MPETVRSMQADRQLELARREHRQRSDKIKLLKEQLEAAGAGHRRRMTEVKIQNMNRLNIIRRFIDEATTATTHTKANKKRKSEPVSPTISRPAEKNSSRSPSPVAGLERGNVQNSLPTPNTEQNEMYSSSPLQVKVDETGKELYRPAQTRNRIQACAKLSKKAGHLAITVLKHYYSADGCCPNHNGEVSKSRELQNQLDQANEVKEKAEGLVASLQEQIEDLNIELKGLSNEQKDSRRRYEQRLHSCQKKYNARVKALERQMESGDLLQQSSNWTPTAPFTKRPPNQTKGGTDGSKSSNFRGSKKISTQFDQVISSLVLMDNSNGEAEEEGHEEKESELVRLNDRVCELESEVEELKSQYTREKSQRLHVMWCLEAKSRQVQNLLSVQEEHSQLLIQHSQLIKDNNMLRDRLKNRGKNPEDFSTEPTSRKLKLESKYALLQTAEIKRLRKAWKRATEIHPDLEECSSSPLSRASMPHKLITYGRPNRRNNLSSQKDKHSRSKTITVNLQKMVERNSTTEYIQNTAIGSVSPAQNDGIESVRGPFKLEANHQDEALGDTSATFKRARLGIEPYFVYTLQEDEEPVRNRGPIGLDGQQELTQEAATPKWTSTRTADSPDLHATQ